MTPLSLYRDTPLYTLIMASLLAGFLAAIPGIKPAYFPGPSTNSLALQKFVLRPIRHPLLLFSHPCPISRRLLTFTHGEISQNFFRTFPQVTPHSLRRIRTVSQEFAEPAKTGFMSKTLKTGSMLPPEEIFPNFFRKIFPENPDPLPRSNGSYLTLRRNFSKKFFQKILGARRGLRKLPVILDREKIFPKFFLGNFWNPGTYIQVKKILGKKIVT